MKRNYNKYTFYTDRFPFLIVAIIVVLAIILVFQFTVQYPLQFFSGGSATTQSPASTSYNILVASPTHDEVFDFANKNEYIPIEVKFKNIEGINYNLNLVINDKETIKTFSSPPYEYKWRPPESGEYTTVANLVDNSNKILSSSNKVKFVVNLKNEEEVTTSTEGNSEIMALTTEDTIEDVAPVINLQIFEGPVYPPGTDICYYRVKAVVTGDPAPVVYFSKDDSGGAWGKNKAQVNLKKGESYDLMVTAVNSAGTVTNHLVLTWGQ
ncbi:MAG: hypothetical protein ACYCXB_06705 [Candidatus Humimicrobiaceae bacterium]